MPLLLILSEGNEETGTAEIGIFTSYRHLLSDYPVHQQVHMIVALLFGAIVLKNLLGYAGRLLGTRLELWTIRDLRMQLFERYMTSAYQFFLDRKQGRLVNDLFGESGMVGQAVSTFVVLLSNVVTVLALYVLLLVISWQATLVATVTFAVLTAVLQSLSPISKRLGYLRQRLTRDIVAFGTEVILGIRQVKVFSAESRLIKRFTEFAHQVSQANLRLVIGICFCCGRPQRPQEAPKGAFY